MENEDAHFISLIIGFNDQGLVLFDWGNVWMMSGHFGLYNCLLIIYWSFIGWMLIIAWDVWFH